MNALSALTPPIDTLKPVAGLNAAAPMSGPDQARRAAIKKTAEDFEASYLSNALGSMFAGVSVAPPFGGGEAEQTFRSFLNEAMAKQIVKRGGVGVAAAVQREMLKMQGMNTEPVR